jgi:hypothetical protein
MQENELDEWRQKMRNGAITDPNKILAAMQERVDLNASLYRLELLYDENRKTVILQGNQYGLETLLEAITRLVRSSTELAHVHFDSVSGFSKNDLDLIIQFVGDSNIVAHRVDDQDEP